MSSKVTSGELLAAWLKVEVGCGKKVEKSNPDRLITYVAEATRKDCDAANPGTSRAATRWRGLGSVVGLLHSSHYGTMVLCTCARFVHVTRPKASVSAYRRCGLRREWPLTCFASRSWIPLSSRL
jgi:hypothetical protein